MMLLCLLQQLQEPFVICDAQFECLHASLGFEQLSGLSTAEILGRQLNDILNVLHYEQLSVDVLTTWKANSSLGTAHRLLVGSRDAKRQRLAVSATALPADPGFSEVQTNGDRLLIKFETIGNGGKTAAMAGRAFDQMPQAAAIIDVTPPALLAHANDAFWQLTGYTADELLGHSLLDLHAPGSEQLRQALAVREPSSLTLMLSSKSGTLVPVTLQLSPVFEAGLVAQMLVVYNSSSSQQAAQPCANGAEGDDVCLHDTPVVPSERRLTAGHMSSVSAAAVCHQLQDMQDSAMAKAASAGDCPAGVAPLLAAAAEVTQLALTVISTSTQEPTVVWCNRAFEELSGYTRTSVEGQPWCLLNSPDTDPAHSYQIYDTLVTGQSATVEVVQCKANGQKFWNQVYVAPICCDGSGTAAHAVMVQQDVTDRKAADAAFLLRDHALSNLSEGITIADPNLPDSPIVYINDAFTRITGYQREEVLGRNCRFLQGPETDPDAIDHIRSANRDGRGLTVEILNYRKNGEKFWNLLSITPVRDKNGRLISLIGVQSNITELIRRKEAEKALLEAKIAAETATEAKSMFLANMSHEIRTPLNGMIATAQLLLASSLGGEQRELMETILDSGSTLLGILGDILDFSKIDHGSVVLQKEPLDLRQTMEACIEIVAADALKKGLEIAYSIDERAARQRLLGDSIRVRQVLANILSNAVKFTEEGEVVMCVTVEEVPADELGRNRIHIAVRDSGIGISEESATKLFQSFRQGHESMSRKYGGTGLGLAISKRLAELMNGTIWVESELGRGSTFHFTMLAPWAPQGSTPPEEPFRSPGSTTQSSLQDMLTAAERFMLQGRQVLVDVAHEPTRVQVCESCALLGMRTTVGDSSTLDVCNFEMAVMGLEAAAEAVRGGWKGRPIVALGSRDSLPLSLHPLVAVVPKPVKHAKLVAALVKSCCTLKWKSSQGLKGPGGVPVGMDSFNFFKVWARGRRATGPHDPLVMDSEEMRRTSLDNSALDRPAKLWVTRQDGRKVVSCDCPPLNSTPGGSVANSTSTTPTPELEDANGTEAPQPAPAQRLSRIGSSRLSAASTSIPENSIPRGWASPARHDGGTSLAVKCNDDGQPLRILIAEDNKVNQKVVLKVLQQVVGGCQPDVVENGLQVLQALEHKVYDIILMDIHMPEMDGLEASRQIRERYAPQDRPRIIALTADTLQVLHDRCRDAGIDEFITKPFRVEDLQRVMQCSTRITRVLPPDTHANGGLAAG